MDSSTKKTIWSIIAVIIILVVGYLVLKGPSSPSFVESSDSSAVEAPVIEQEQLLGKKPLSDGQTDAISVHKAEILARISSGEALTQEEKGAIGNIMLTQAHLYKFTEAEREAVFSALRQ